jgi:hypothetical protein
MLSGWRESSHAGSDSAQDGGAQTYFQLASDDSMMPSYDVLPSTAELQQHLCRPTATTAGKAFTAIMKNNEAQSFSRCIKKHCNSVKRSVTLH